MLSETSVILAFCQREIPSATVGVIAPLTHLMESSIIDFTFVESHRVTPHLIANADVVIGIRCSDPAELEIFREAKRLGKKLIYYLDDDLLNVSPQSQSNMYFSNLLVRDSIQECIRLCDVFWTNNVVIAEKYDADGRRTIVTDAPALLLTSTSGTKEFKVADRDKDEIVVGFAGGTDHNYYLESFFEQIVRELMCKYGNRIKFQIFGARPKFKEDLHYDHIPWTSSHSEYVDRMLSLDWDIAIAPLPDSTFHQCKYYNKFLEYGVMGVIGVYSNVMPYTMIVENRVNGILVANTAEDWISTLSDLIDNLEKYKGIGTNALEFVYERFNIDTVSSNIQAELSEEFQYKAQKVSPEKVKLPMTGKGVLSYKVINILKTHRWGAFKYIIKKIKERASTGGELR